MTCHHGDPYDHLCPLCRQAEQRRRVAEAVGILKMAGDAELDLALEVLSNERLRRRAREQRAMEPETVAALIREGRR